MSITLNTFYITMTKQNDQVTYSRWSLGGTYSFIGFVHDCHGREHGRRKTGLSLEWCWQLTSLYISRRQRQLRIAWTFETSKITPSTTTPPTRPYLQILLTQSANWGPCIQICESMGTFLIQSTAVGMDYVWLRNKRRIVQNSLHSENKEKCIEIIHTVLINMWVKGVLK